MSSSLPRPQHRGGTKGWFDRRGVDHEAHECETPCLLHDHSECCNLPHLRRTFAAAGLRFARRRNRLFMKAILGE